MDFWVNLDASIYRNMQENVLFIKLIKYYQINQVQIVQ